jgi:mannosyl-oligosaccharide alpha-1,2-mannosidase
MVLKLRRYRVFLAFAVIATLALVQFVRMRDWSLASPIPVHPVKEPTAPKGSLGEPVAPPSFIAEEQPKQKQKPKPKPASDDNDGKKASSDSTSSSGDSDTQSRPVKTKPDTSKQGEDTSKDTLKDPYSSYKDEFSAEGEGRHEVDTSNSDMPEIHWEKQPEHFPVAEQDVIKLPKGQTKEIPKIQYNFSPESETLKKIRQRRQAAVKESFANSWKGYKETAWGHDELRPVTGGYRDPFSGWGATLVDSLDTLWIMGMKEEFEDTVKQVRKIDFTTSFRKDIPLFETVIRYLGGLISAYDITEGHYVVLLDKAIELADILMGAFDTPNRMPMTYYNWAP